MHESQCRLLWNMYEPEQGGEDPAWSLTCNLPSNIIILGSHEIFFPKKKKKTSKTDTSLSITAPLPPTLTTRKQLTSTYLLLETHDDDLGLRPTQIGPRPLQLPPIRTRSRTRARSRLRLPIVDRRSRRCMPDPRERSKSLRPALQNLMPRDMGEFIPFA